MTAEGWERICDFVTEEMRSHTRPFATPLMRGTALAGSGNYVALNEDALIMTCQHVAKRGELDYRLYGLSGTFSNHGEWLAEPPPVDLALAPLLHNQWEALEHEAQLVPYDRFGQQHAPFDPYELLFFRGYAGENSSTFGNFTEANASAYASQQKKGSGSAEYFEILWKPGEAQYTFATTEEERAKVRYEDPRGFSGSLVWNTRYREVTASQRQWTPADAVVTGMAHRWDEDTKTLLVYRVEHVRRFVEAKLNTQA